MNVKFRVRTLFALVLATAALGCTESVTNVMEPAVKSMPTRGPSHEVSSNYSSNQFTVYDENGAWYKLDVAAKEIETSSGVLIEVEDENLPAVINEFAGSVVFDNVSNVFESTVCAPENPCGEPMLVPLSPLKPTNTKESRLKRGDWGYAPINVDKLLKEQDKLFRKNGGVTTFAWPPNCYETQAELRDAKDKYKIDRRTTLQKLSDIASNAVEVDVSSGKLKIGFASLASLAVEALSAFMVKDLSQSRVSIMAGLYAGACGSNQLPNTSGSFGNLPHTELVCETVYGQISLDGGLTYHDTSINVCHYQM